MSLLRALQDQPTGPGQQVVVCAELQDMPATDGYDPAGETRVCSDARM